MNLANDVVHVFLQLLMKTSARQTAKTATPLEQLRQALERVSYLLKDLFLIAMCFYSMVVCLSTLSTRNLLLEPIITIR